MTNFIQNERGAITIDWVVITAGLVGLGIAVAALTSTALESKSTEITELVDRQKIWTRFQMKVGLDFSTGVGDSGFFSEDGSSGFISFSEEENGLFAGVMGSDGQPGFLVYEDVPDGVGYMNIDSNLQGDLSTLYGGTISFDSMMLNMDATPEASWLEGNSMVRIVGANGMVLHTSTDYAPVQGSWSSFNTSLTEGNWTVNGQPASRAQIEAVLSDVSRVQIRGEQAGGPDLVGFDNIQITEPYIAPV